MISKLYIIYRKDGIKVLVEKIFDKFSKIFFSKKLLNIYIIETEGFSLKMNALIDIECKFATEEEMKNFNEEDGEYDRNAKKYLFDRMKKGDRCAIAITGGEIVGYVWVMKNNMELSENRFVNLSNDKAYLYKAFVKKEYRGNRILHGLDKFVIDKLQAEGCRYIITAIDEINISSHRARVREGYKIIGQISSFRFFGFKFNMFDKDTLKILREPYVQNS